MMTFAKQYTAVEKYTLFTGQKTHGREPHTVLKGPQNTPVSEGKTTLDKVFFCKCLSRLHLIMLGLLAYVLYLLQ